MSHWIHLHELLLTGELDNEHVPIRNNSNSSPQQRTLKSPERKNNLLSQPNSCSRQGNLEVCFSKKSLKRGHLPALLLPWLTALSRGATPQDTLIQSDTPDLSWAVRLARHAARTAWLKRPHHATQAVPSQPSFPGLPLLPPQEPASRILRTQSQTATQSQRLPSQNKAVPSEFGSDIVLAFLRRALRWTKHFSKWIIVFSLLQMACFAGQGWFFFLLWPYTIYDIII